MDARTGVIMMCLIGFTCEEMVKFDVCFTPSGKVSSVHVDPCNTVTGINVNNGSQRCRLHRGHSYTVSVTFTSDVESKTSKAEVYGVIFQVPLNIPIPQDDGCESGIHCPIQQEKTYTYVGTLTVPQLYPNVDLVVHWELTDDHDNHLFCIRFPVRIVN